MVLSLLDSAPSDWFGPVMPDIDGRTIWMAALTRAFRSAITLLRSRLGPDISLWNWGRCHQLKLQHSFGESSALGKIFNLGPYPVCGDANTIWQSGPLSTNPFTTVVGIPVLRLIVEMGPKTRAEFALAGGQSGRRGEEHFADLLEDWRHGRYRPLHTDRSTVESTAQHQLLLDPNSNSNSSDH